MIKLEQYFKGEESWNKYSSCFSSNWHNSDFETKLLGYLKNKIDFAQVIYFHLQENSINWLNSKVPDLDNLTPMECINDKELINRLKVFLRRFPC
jgi:hypothetical protein